MPAKQPIMAPSKQPKLQLSIIEIYEKYHNAEEVKSMAVIEKEVTRCEELAANVADDDIADALEERIDVLRMTQDSIGSDI